MPIGNQVIEDAEALEEELTALEAVLRGHREAVERFGHEQATVPINVGTLDRLLRQVRQAKARG
jgi:hypothetical protein